tara:strand:+ start:1685 stop:3064 length:1380 start_codon:yes stop_codon:yes gene_type:complete
MSNETKMNDLPELKDIFNSFECPPFSKLSTTDYQEIQESASILIDTYILENVISMAEPNFHDTLFDSIYKLLELQCCDIYDFNIEEDLTKIISEVLYNYFGLIIPKRSYRTTFIRVENPNIKKLEEKIQDIVDRPQPEQRTDAWYEFRYNLITASSAWKVFESQSQQNQLIYEKCCPLNLAKYASSNTETPLHWGQKYEPVSVEYYEKKYKTTVSDFGCVPHHDYKCLGASPDGINTDKKSVLYGRMLEIKNIVNREITGIPKKEYWIQMQLQMETCNLNECDFLETRFKEYESHEAFQKDGTFTHTESGNLKGIMMYFIKDKRPHYEYAPLSCSEKEYEKWEQDMMEKNEELSWIKNIYWYLDEISCVLVLRNKEWFKAAIPFIEKTWDIIEKERVSGYAHRGPRTKKGATKPKLNSKNKIPKQTIMKLDSCVIDTNQEAPLIKVRTESFDSTTGSET